MAYSEYYPHECCCCGYLGKVSDVSEILQCHCSRRMCKQGCKRCRVHCSCPISFTAEDAAFLKDLGIGVEEKTC